MNTKKHDRSGVNGVASEERLEPPPRQTRGPGRAAKTCLSLEAGGQRLTVFCFVLVALVFQHTAAVRAQVLEPALEWSSHPLGPAGSPWRGQLANDTAVVSFDPPVDRTDGRRPSWTDRGGHSIADLREQVLELDEEMRAWLQEEVIVGTARSRRLERLAEALTSPRFGIRSLDFPEPTPTARQVFASRRANCVGFAALFAALARELDEPVYFVLLPRVDQGGRWDDLEVFEDHLVVAAGRGRRVVYYDQNGRIEQLPSTGEPVTDLRLLSIYWSNRGVEALVGGDGELAVDRLEWSVKLDPLHSTGWVNLGVARRRSADATGAEQALRRALEIRPGAPGAVHNLTALLHLTGRSEEARRFALQWATPDPLEALRQAQSLLGHGDVDGARQLYARALQLSRRSRR